MTRPLLTINPTRLSRDEAYLQMAEIWAKRSKANRLQVGTLIVLDDAIISDGYNGMPAGTSAEEEVCEFYNEDGTLATKDLVLHSEANAISKLAKHGGKGSAGAELFSTHSPCPNCAKLIIQAKIKRVVYRNQYRLTEGVDTILKYGIEVVHVPKVDKTGHVWKPFGMFSNEYCCIACGAIDPMEDIRTDECKPGPRNLSEERRLP